MSSGSTESKVIALAPHRQYRYAAAVVALKARVTVGTARQWFKPSDPSSPVARMVLLIDALVECGDLERAEGLIQPILAARAVFRHVALSDELQTQEQEIDGREDEAQLAWNLNKCPATWDTYRRIVVKNIAVLSQVLQAGDAEHRA